MVSARLFLLLAVLQWCSVVHPLNAQIPRNNGIQLSIFCNPGISGVYGDGASASDFSPDFFFSPGIRVRFNQAFDSQLILVVDVGFLDVAYTADLDATDSHCHTTYKFLSGNMLAGIPIANNYYVLGGFYYARSLGGEQYEEEMDLVFLDQKDDLGLVAEFGKEVSSSISLGLQGRYGLVSISEAAEIKTWTIQGTIGLNISPF